MQTYVKAALDAYGAIDCFYNNAGIEGSVAPTAEYDEEMFDRVMAVNVKGVFLGLRHVLPVMIKQGRGAVVNTASVAGLVASPGMPAYVASKHAVIGLTKTAAGEVARAGVRVNAVCPGPIDTRMIHSLESMLNPDDPASVGARYQSNIPIGRYGTAEEVANVVLFLCSDLAGNITGAQYVVDGGRTATGGAVTNNSFGDAAHDHGHCSVRPAAGDRPRGLPAAFPEDRTGLPRCAGLHPQAVHPRRERRVAGGSYIWKDLASAQGVL